MPTLFKNGKNYSGTSVSLTQAEYDALTETQKNDGTVYFITDSDAVLDASDVALGSGTVETLAGSIATIETSPATANHSVGEYIVYNGQLYMVTAAITAGTTLTGKIQTATVFQTVQQNIYINGLSCRFVKCGRTVVLSIPDGSITNAVATGGTVGNIPDGFVPYGTPILFKDDYSSKRLNFTPDGTIVVQGDAIAAGTYIRGSITYICK